MYLELPHFYLEILVYLLQIPNVDSSNGWSHVPGPLHVPMSMGYLQQGRRGPSHTMEKDGGFSLGLSPSQVNNGNFSSMDAAAQFPDELGLGDTSSSVPSINSSYGASQNLGRSPIGNQAASISASAQSMIHFFTLSSLEKLMMNLS